MQMPESLSQSQIDELLKRMHSGEVDTEVEKKPKIKEYDFKTPKKFTKEQLKALDGLHENFSRVLSSYFSSILRNVCEVSVLQIEEQRYYEFNNALPDNSLLSILNFKPEDIQYDETSFIVDIPTPLGFMIIERLLGGIGEVFVPNRDFTEIELAMLETILEQVTAYLQDAWCNYLPVKTELGSLETNARLLQVFSPQEIVVLVALKIEVAGTSNVITMCLPAESLEPIVESFKLRYTRANKQQDIEKDKEKREVIIGSIKQSDMEITAILDNFQMTLGDVLRLQVNDVIALDKKIDSDICVLVDDVPWYTAKLGESKLKKSIKLIDIIAG